jgi:hypothetical protein
VAANIPSLVALFCTTFLANQAHDLLERGSVEEFEKMLSDFPYVEEHVSLTFLVKEISASASRLSEPMCIFLLKFLRHIPVPNSTEIVSMCPGCDARHSIHTITCSKMNYSWTWSTLEIFDQLSQQ